MRFHLVVLLSISIGFSFLGAAGCEAEVRDFDTSGGSSSSSGVTMTSSGAVVEIPKGECLSNAECMSGACYELFPGGYSVCVGGSISMGCTDPMLDKCCSDAECAMGEYCVPAPVVPSCGGPFMPPQNVCAVPECSSDADCQNMMSGPAACISAGIFGRPLNTCLPAPCLSHADCTEEPNGACVPIVPTCCSGPVMMACAYASDGCLSDAYCPPDFHCEVQGQRARCVPGAVACPG